MHFRLQIKNRFLKSLHLARWLKKKSRYQTRDSNCLRFEDTNPLNEKVEYYDAIAEGLKWLGVKPDIVKNTSDDIELLHDYGRRLIELDGAYVCICSQEMIHDLRARGIPCECRR